MWVLADSVNGYFSRLEVYCGKQPGRVETGLGSRVVRSLTADFSGKSYLVAFDHFFTSYDLLEDLLEDGVYACGTARTDRRGFPVQLNLKLKNTQIETLHGQGIYWLPIFVCLVSITPNTSKFILQPHSQLEQDIDDKKKLRQFINLLRTSVCQEDQQNSVAVHKTADFPLMLSID